MNLRARKRGRKRKKDKNRKPYDEGSRRQEFDFRLSLELGSRKLGEETGVRQKLHILYRWVNTISLLHKCI